MTSSTRRRRSARLSEGRYEARPDARFALVAPGGNAPPAVNGGALIATVLRAVLDDSPHPHPVATSGATSCGWPGWSPRGSR